MTQSSATDSSRVTIDLTAPTLTSVHIESDNAGPSNRANAGDVITVTLTSNEAIVGPTVTIAGQPATVEMMGADYRMWSASYTVAAADVDDGSASFSIAFEDLASNAGTTVTSVTDGSAVTLDLTPPTLTTVSMSLTNTAATTTLDSNSKLATATNLT